MIALASSFICQLPWQLLFDQATCQSVHAVPAPSFPPNRNQIWPKGCVPTGFEFRALGFGLWALCVWQCKSGLLANLKHKPEQLSRNSSIIHIKYSFVQKVCIHFVFDVSLIEFARCFWQFSLSTNTHSFELIILF